jgi:hypothetical protein
MARSDEAVVRLEYSPARVSGPFRDVHLQIGKRVYVLANNDYAVEQFLDQLVLARTQDDDQARLLSFRKDFREIVATRPIAGLVKCFVTRASSEQQRLAVWLLGHCGQKSEATLLFEQAGWCSLIIRREIVRSLRRLNALRECARMGACEEDQRLKRIANSTKRDFRKTLAKWQVPDAVAVAPPSRPFELLVDVGDASPHRPKSPDFIRRVLERIRLLLRGSL